MNYKPTILNIVTGFFLIWILIYTIWNYKILSVEEGWGIVAMIGLGIIGIVAGIVDFFLQILIENRIILNIIGLVLVIGLSLVLLLGL